MAVVSTCCGSDKKQTKIKFYKDINKLEGRMTPKIAYLISRFPSQYQSYVAREILAMKRRGYGTKIFSLKKPGDIGHQDARPLLEDTYHLPFIACKSIWVSNIRLMVSNPRLYVGLILYILRHNVIDPKTLGRALAVFPKTVHYASIMKQEGISHIHAHWSTIPALCAIICSRILGIHYSVTCHAVDIFENNTMLEKKLSQASFVVTCAGHNKKHLVQTFPALDPRKIFVNYHGFDMDKVKRKKMAKPGRLEIISVGRLEPSKGYKYLLEACYTLKIKGTDNFHCTIIGDGPQKDFLMRLVKELELKDMVTIKGAMPYEQVIQHYETASISVLAAVSEFHRGIPNVVAESMAMEVPVVTTPLPAIGELIENGINGIIVPEKDAAALTKALKVLLKTSELRTKLAIEGRKTVESLFNMHRTYDELSGIFERQLSK